MFTVLFIIQLRLFQMWFAFGALAAGGLATGYILQPTVDAAELELHPPLPLGSQRLFEFT